jgi:hypothetical protein
MWGLHVEFSLSLAIIVLWQITITAVGWAFLAWWLAKHNGDWQDAGMPMTLILTALAVLSVEDKKSTMPGYCHHNVDHCMERLGAANECPKELSVKHSVSVRLHVQLYPKQALPFADDCHSAGSSGIISLRAHVKYLLPQPCLSQRLTQICLDLLSSPVA